MLILGISAFYHDSAAALVRDGQILAAAQEERFTRKKHDSRFPNHAVEYCLAEAGVTLEQIDNVVFYDKPFLKFERLLETYLAFAPSGYRSFRMALPLWVREKLFQKGLLHKKLKQYGPGFDWQNKLLFAEHHLSHAASAFFPSPFETAAVLTMDGVGEWTTSSVALGKGSHLEILKEIHFPHSLGLLYSAFTYYTGFKVNSGEYKLMGLAPYGQPKYAQLILDHLLDVKPDGSFRSEPLLFRVLHRTEDDERQVRCPVRWAGAKCRRTSDAAPHGYSRFNQDRAWKHVILRLTRSLAAETGAENLCLAGGVALNCVANGRILRDGSFQNIWTQPAAGDAGGALGAALAAYHLYKDQPRHVNGGDAMRGAYLGPAFSQNEIESQAARGWR